MSTTTASNASHRNGEASTAARLDRVKSRQRANSSVPLIAVIGGCGGAGASTLAASVAVAALRMRRQVILFDADSLGGGLAPLVALGTLLCGREERAEQPWPHGIDPPDGEPLPQRDGTEPDLALVTWGGEDGDRIPVAAMRNALRTLRGSADIVVVDLPRCIDDSTQLVLAEATHTLVIAPVSERAAVATGRLLPRLALLGPPPLLVARLPGRDELTARQFAQALGVPLAGVIKPRRGSLPRGGQAGQLGGRYAPSLDRFSRRLIERCGIASAAEERATGTQVIV
ncbi:hypothetical protein KGA66_06945 [Actinocrinis puniceicyclus]|uniref:Uncharacterized protein n=1 Tax=Actinocrinis puniceicyclus TaxID=977794 RepID=A0A8J7WIA5_9ACTN|nr:hypothetical protein [Actinocrinis puniceicyclus]MBS2962773.1 hypothetical protein [Actinocrinis puniceicyclus]